MNIFLDTSSLFKLYHKEAGTEELEQLFINQKIAKVFLAEIARIEFSSVVWRKCRMKEIDFEQAKKLLSSFENDKPKFRFIPDDSSVKDEAASLITRHWNSGLRTLDSIQLASAIAEKDNLDLFLTSDLVLKELVEKEGFSVKIPL
jgi:predicted nucleic acid-binding protein